MQKFETIIVLQSYPAVVETLNRIESLKKPICILVNLDKDLYKFISSLEIPDVTVRLLGNSKVFRKSIYRCVRITTLKKVSKTLKKYHTNKLIVTFHHWCDAGALFIDKIEHRKLNVWVPFEEERYNFHNEDKDGLFGHQDWIARETDGLIKNYYFSDSQGNVLGKTVGLDRSHLKLANANFFSLPKPSKVSISPKKLVDEKNGYILFVERELLRSGHISLPKYFQLLWQIYKFGKRFDMTIYVKFKPRQLYSFKKLIFQIFNFQILPAYVPAQYYGFDRNCKIIIGFTSSALAVDYKKPFICLATMKKLYRKSLAPNVESLIQRSDKTHGIYFLYDLEELKKLKKEFILSNDYPNET